MSPTIATTDARPMRADEVDYIGWAEYVERWLLEQDPRFMVKEPPSVPQEIVYDDLPWATHCLMDVFNG